MFDIWLSETELTRLCLILSLAVLLPGQLWLCFRVKRLIWRLLPVIVLAGATAALLLLAAAFSTAWESLGYALLAALAVLLLGLCGAGWAIWWLIGRKQARRGAEQ